MNNSAHASSYLAPSCSPRQSQTPNSLNRLSSPAQSHVGRPSSFYPSFSQHHLSLDPSTTNSTSVAQLARFAQIAQLSGLPGFPLQVFGIVYSFI